MPPSAQMGAGFNLPVCLPPCLAHPLFDQTDFVQGQPPLSGELSKTGLRQPGRHIAAAGDFRDLPGMVLDLLEGQQVEGS